MNNSQQYTIPFLSKTELAKDTYVFNFKKPEGFDFISGQYNRWTLPITANDGRGSSRFFTISSSPLDPQIISFTTKIGESDFKKALIALQEGEEIKIFGPMGQFIFNQEVQKPQVFLAGGIGITPFHSFIQYAAGKNLNIPLFLFASFSAPEEIIYYDELKKLEAEHSSIHIIYTITKPEASQRVWSGDTGRISEALLKKYITNIYDCTFYIVGPPPMVDGTAKLLSDIQIPSENSKTEQFTGY